ncbi:MAG: hypothetical protein N2204_04885 [Anaerolineae bacterium]|nr:hypothetical protein [Anaerolineae bacterium]
MGNLASTLARSATVSVNTQSATLTSDLLREGMWIIEWSAPDAPLEVLAELAPMQLELGLLRQAWTRDPQAVQPILAFRARTMSDRVLELSGLLGV